MASDSGRDVPIKMHKSVSKKTAEYQQRKAEIINVNHGSHEIEHSVPAQRDT